MTDINDATERAIKTCTGFNAPSCSRTVIGEFRAELKKAGYGITPICSAEPIIAILEERRRQVEEDGFSHRPDDEYRNGQLAMAASAYAFHGGSSSTTRTMAEMERMAPSMWPWLAESFRPKSHREDLVKAGALIVAEIERLDRLAKIEGKSDAE